MRSPGPLWRAAARHLVGSGAWGLLVAASFVLLSAAASSGPMFAEAGRNAAMRSALSAVPATAAASEAAVVRVVGPSSDETLSRSKQDQLRDRVAQVPGLSAPELSGVSVSGELLPNSKGYGFRAEKDRRSVSTRLVAAPRPRDALVPVAVAPAGGAGGVWLSAQAAAELGVSPGARFELVSSLRGTRPRRVEVTLAGTYRTGPDGRRPADRPGSSYWSLRRAALPGDVQFSTLTARLVVADTATAQLLAERTGDEILWLVDAGLAPGNDTLAGVGRTARGIEAIRVELVEAESYSDKPEVLKQNLASGVSSLYFAAKEVADATTSRASTLSRGAVLLALGSVGAVGLLGLRRRRTELRLSTALGIRPPTLGALAVLENLPAAVLGVALGAPLAYAVVRAVGPDGTIATAAVRRGVTTAALLALAGLALLFALTLVTALRTVRPSSDALRRRPPVEALIVVAAVTAAAGLLTGPDDSGGQGALALLVPFLVVAAVGALGGRLLLSGLRLLPSRAPAAGVARGGRRGRRLRWTAWLAVRRLRGPGSERSAVVGILASGLGLLLFAFSAAGSTARTSDDRVAVAAGSAATALIDDSSALDPSPPRQVTPGPKAETNRARLARLHSPPLPRGQTVVWRTRVGIGSSYGNVELLVIDPAGFGAAAEWGSGGALAPARALLPRLRAADAAAVEQLASTKDPVVVPVLAVNYPGLPRGARARVLLLNSEVSVEVVGATSVFPGLGAMPMLVAPQTSLLFQAPGDDPRIAGNGSISQAGYFTASLWSSRGAADLAATLDAHDVTPKTTATTLQARAEPEIVSAARSLGYLRALGVCVALIALLAFAMYADRAAARARATDLLLADVGFGAGGARAARLVELAALSLGSLVLALVAVTALRPMAARLLDPQSGSVVSYAFGVDPDGLLVTALAALAALLVAGAAALSRGRQGSREEVLRAGE